MDYLKEVCPYVNRSDVLDYVNYIDSQGVEHTERNHLNYYWDFEPIEMTTDEHWQDVLEKCPSLKDKKDWSIMEGRKVFR